MKAEEIREWTARLKNRGNQAEVKVMNIRVRLKNGIVQSKGEWSGQPFRRGVRALIDNIMSWHNVTDIDDAAELARFVLTRFANDDDE